MLNGEGFYGAKCQPAHQGHIHTFTHRWKSHQERFGVRYLAHGHFDRQTGGASDRTTNALIIWTTRCPPEPQIPANWCS